MSNSTHPIQNIIKLVNPTVKPNIFTTTEVDLGINEFIDNDDKFGLFSRTEDPYQFMSIERQDT